MQSTVARLQKATADPSATTRFTILNPVAVPTTGSNALTGGSTIGRSTTAGRRGSPPLPASVRAMESAQSEMIAASQAECSLLQDALETAEADRLAAVRENEQLRGVVGEVDEWAEEMLALRGVDDGSTRAHADEVSSAALRASHAGGKLT